MPGLIVLELAAVVLHGRLVAGRHSKVVLGISAEIYMRENKVDFDRIEQSKTSTNFIFGVMQREQSLFFPLQTSFFQLSIW